MIGAETLQSKSRLVEKAVNELIDMLLVHNSLHENIVSY